MANPKTLITLDIEAEYMQSDTIYVPEKFAQAFYIWLEKGTAVEVTMETRIGESHIAFVFNNEDEAALIYSQIKQEA
jgi:hypothetical protein